MALKTKIKLTPNYDWKSIKLDDITGTGITGYGNNQDPATYREASADGVDIQGTIIWVTSPSNAMTSIVLTSTQAYDVVINGKSITNSALGFLTDETLTDGIWKIEYAPRFISSIYGLTRIGTTDVFTFASNAYLNYVNATHIYHIANNAYYPITALDRTNSKLTVTGVPVSTTLTVGYHIVYNAPLYVPIAKAIKECLDNKVADETLCCCDKVNCELVNKYLLYDAMFVNCVNSNATKAQQIFDLLTTYCGDNCGC